MLAGLVTPNSGRVLLEGKQLLPAAYDVKRQVGFVPQEIALYDELSAQANLEFFAGMYGLDGQVATSNIARVLEIVGLADRKKEPVRNYSGGMKRRLNIAAGLVHQPKVLILDEPTVGVDPQSRNAIFDALEALQSEGITLLYTTHYMEEVERLCDQIAIMDAGKIVAEGTKDSLYRLLPAKNSFALQFASPESATLFADHAKSNGLNVRVSESELETDTEDLAATLQVVAEIGKKIPFESMNTHRVTLEQVFLHLTGKSLRD